jgi:hypothetical protein
MAREWAISVGIDPERVVCSGIDSNGDSYTSCTIVPRGASGDPSKMLYVECSLFGGCRQQSLNRDFRSTRW